MSGRVAVLGFLLAVAAAVAAMLAGLGTRWGWWDFRAGFAILRWAVYGGIGGAALSLLGLGFALRAPKRRGALLALLGIMIGLVTVYVPWQWRRTAERVPPIHDITTDLENPPPFDAILPLRAEAANPAEYGGDSIAQQQRQGYPELGPLVLDAPPAEVIGLALDTAREMGWEIVDSDGDEGRIEATDTTFWFGFKDDVVIRITEPPGGGTRVDVRSVSRVGQSDVGTNAARIREFLERLEEEARG
ncbi:MAG TPA: DUF1499 domain-containing protein [Gemmatimonadota bacterium]|nr:DUF1499 domain-containing protein [Gemmatimonadota bacterium]